MEFSQLDGTEDTLMAKRVRQYEEQYVFKLTCHFIHNYICDVVRYILCIKGLNIRYTLMVRPNA